MPVQQTAYNETKAHFMQAVQGHFNDTLGRPELLNRFGDNIIVFDFINDPSDSFCNYVR